MFSNFLKFFNKEMEVVGTGNSYKDFIDNFSGMQFGEGVFNVFKKEDIKKWSDIVGEAFVDYAGKFNLFAYDWLGRCFAVCFMKDKKEKILMFDISTNEALTLDSSLTSFLDDILPIETDGCIARTFFEEWRDYSNEKLLYGNCIGYKKPLFLGGSDELENLENIDMDVYWSITTQILMQI